MKGFTQSSYPALFQEDYKTLIGISIAKVHHFLRLKLYDFTQLQNINHKKL